MSKNKNIKSRQEKDDLKRIRGIGPFIEHKLNEIGITSFWQIAKFNNVEISFISQYIGLFPERIKRDNWMASAKKLLILKESLNNIS